MLSKTGIASCHYICIPESGRKAILQRVQKQRSQLCAVSAGKRAGGDNDRLSRIQVYEENIVEFKGAGELVNRDGTALFVVGGVYFHHTFGEGDGHFLEKRVIGTLGVFENAVFNGSDVKEKPDEISEKNIRRQHEYRKISQHGTYPEGER